VENTVMTYPTITPYLLYEDVTSALGWLASAFGLRERLRFTEEDGRVSHAEMELGDGVVMIGQPGGEYRNPKRAGHVSVMVHVYVDDLAAHFERARAAGARITAEPADQPYGDRRYGAEDPEGHEWTFAQHVRDVVPEDWGAARP
jgi:PhnB protein